MSTLKTNDLIKKLVEAQMLPPQTRRMIIDINIDDITKVYYSCYATNDLMDLIEPKDLIYGLFKEDDRPRR